jgi:hypothetical protein
MIKAVKKAVEDSRFRTKLLRDPKGTLSGLNLSRSEFSAITQLTNSSFDYIGTSTKSVSLTQSPIITPIREDPKTWSRYSLTDFINLGK